MTFIDENSTINNICVGITRELHNMQKKRRRNINKQVIILAALVAVGIISFFMYKRCLTEKTLDISMGMKILNEIRSRRHQ